MVRRWNEEFETPKLAIATSHDLFSEFERRYGDLIPAVKGDFTPYWEDGAASTALETAMNRRSVTRLLQAQTLWAMLAPKAFPAADFDEAWRQALLWDEHTWGAADSVSDPDGGNARLQWDYKRAFAVEADRRSKSLLAAALKRPGQAGPGLRVLNTCSWDRSGIVRIPGNDSKAGDSVADADGRPVLSQRLTTGELALKADGVPAFGSKSYALGPGSSASPTVGRASASGTTLENGRVKIIIDPVSGAVAGFLWAARGNIELVDRSALPGLNSYFYVPGLDPKTAVGVRTAEIKVKEKGPLVASLLVESEAPGGKGLVREYILTADSDRLEIIDRLDKTKVRDKEAVHIGFPFRVPGGVLRLDLGWGWIRPEADLIAGSCRDFFGLQNAADISNADYGVTWVSLDVPLAEVGAMTDEARADKGTRRWRTSLDPSQTLYSYVMNNYWHTNYKADQEGPIELRYAVEPHPGRERQTAKRIGMDLEQPLLAVPGAAGMGPVSPVLRVSPAAVMITSLRPTADGRGLLVRIFNASDRPVDAALVAPAGASFALADPDGTPGAPLRGRLPLAPFEIITVRLEKAGR
jgi:alpha-mannosidase